MKAIDLLDSEMIRKVKKIKKIFGWSELIIRDKNNKILATETNNT